MCVFWRTIPPNINFVRKLHSSRSLKAIVYQTLTLYHFWFKLESGDKFKPETLPKSTTTRCPMLPKNCTDPDHLFILSYTNFQLDTNFRFRSSRDDRNLVSGHRHRNNPRSGYFRMWTFGENSKLFYSMITVLYLTIKEEYQFNSSWLVI